MPRTREGFFWSEQESHSSLETEAVVNSSPSLSQTYDVVVIGAGFAGLVAARELCRTSKVLLIEGRDRIGGRTWTAQALGEQFEMGGTWVHWNQPHIYSELHRYGLHRNLKTSAGNFTPEKMFFKPASGSVTEIPTVETSQMIEAIGTKFFDIDNITSRNMMPYPHDPFREPAPWKKYDNMTIRQRLDQIDAPQQDKDIFESIVNSLGSAPSTDIGFVELLRWYALSGHSMAALLESAGVYKIGKGGMTSLARAILNEFTGDMALDTIVKAISESANGIAIEIQNGKQFAAKAVVSTIPLNCLSDITFDKPLSIQRQEAINQGHINRGAKIHFKLSQIEPVWFASCSPPSPWCFAFVDHHGTKASPDGTYCIGFGFNSHLTDPTASEDIIQSFEQNIRPGAEVAAYLTHDWMNDPLAKGTWSCWGAGTMSKNLQELQKPHGRVVFASADWADGWRGFVDGAIEQGIKASRDVRELLQADSKA